MACKVLPSSRPFGNLYRHIDSVVNCYRVNRDSTFQAAVVQRLDSAIHRIKIYPMDSAIGFPNTRWIVIYPVDSAIQRLNNRGQTTSGLVFCDRDKEFRHLFLPKLNPLYKGNISLVRDRQNRTLLDFWV